MNLPTVTLDQLPADLADGRARLLVVALDDPDWTHCAGVLDEAERSRASRFRFEADARSFVAAHAALRNVLGHHLGRPPEDLSWAVGPYGKPRLAAQRDPDLHFNLSHTRGMGLIGLSRTAPIGVDIERARALSDRDALVASHFSALEQARFEALPVELRQEAFFALWTCKEAVVKADGRGLSLALDSFSVGVHPGHAPQVLQAPPGTPSDWTLWSARGPEGCWLAAGLAAPAIRIEAFKLHGPCTCGMRCAPHRH